MIEDITVLHLFSMIGTNDKLFLSKWDIINLHEIIKTTLMPLIRKRMLESKDTT